MDFFALSRGTIDPQLVHCTRLLLPLPPLDLPRLFRLNGIYHKPLCSIVWFTVLYIYSQILGVNNVGFFINWVDCRGCLELKFFSVRALIMAFELNLQK